MYTNPGRREDSPIKKTRGACHTVKRIKFADYNEDVKI